MKKGYAKEDKKSAKKSKAFKKGYVFGKKVDSPKEEKKEK